MTLSLFIGHSVWHSSWWAVWRERNIHGFQWWRWGFRKQALVTPRVKMCFLWHSFQMCLLWYIFVKTSHLLCNILHLFHWCAGCVWILLNDRIHVYMCTFCIFSLSVSMDSGSLLMSEIVDIPDDSSPSEDSCLMEVGVGVRARPRGDSEGGEGGEYASFRSTQHPEGMVAAPSGRPCFRGERSNSCSSPSSYNTSTYRWERVKSLTTVKTKSLLRCKSSLFSP